MKKVIQNRVQQIKKLLKRKHAFFWVEAKEHNFVINEATVTHPPGIYYTYPKDGWVHKPTIDGRGIEYVAAHDDTPNAPPLPPPFNMPDKLQINIVFAKVGKV